MSQLEADMCVCKSLDLVCDFFSIFFIFLKSWEWENVFWRLFLLHLLVPVGFSLIKAQLFSLWWVCIAAQSMAAVGDQWYELRGGLSCLERAVMALLAVCSTVVRFCFCVCVCTKIHPSVHPSIPSMFLCLSGAGEQPRETQAFLSPTTSWKLIRGTTEVFLDRPRDFISPPCPGSTPWPPPCGTWPEHLTREASHSDFWTTSAGSFQWGGVNSSTLSAS